MNKFEGFRCIACDKEFGPHKALYTCLSCGNNLEVLYDYKAIKKRLTHQSLKASQDFSIWRYLDILPVTSALDGVASRVGWTPLYAVRKMAKDFGLGSLHLKDDGRNPSASFKDRASAVVVARALELKERTIAAASTGNAASSLACLTAGRGIKSIIFVPESAPSAKIAQLLVFGSTVFAVRGSYDDAFKLCLEACQNYGWYCRNTGYNPFTREGKKTCAFEICEQLNWRVPDKIFVPVGDGNILSGVWKGFRDFYSLGLIDKLPQLVAVQADNSNSIKRALNGEKPFPAVSAKTIADSISVSVPKDGLAGLLAIKQSKGFAICVSDKEILKAIPEIAQGSGIFVEPAAAAAYAGLKKAVTAGLVKSEEEVVVLLTGNGLKDVSSAMKSVGRPFRVGNIRDVRRFLCKKKS